MARALDTILLGTDPPLERGDEIPKSFHDSVGDEQPVDLERLEELGLVGDPGYDGEPDHTDRSALSVKDLQAIADERDLKVEGTGKKGRVVKDDLVAAVEASDAEQPPE